MLARQTEIILWPLSQHLEATKPWVKTVRYDSGDMSL